MTEKNSNKAAHSAKKFDHLLNIQGLSDKLLKNHLALYQGYAVNANKLADKLSGLLKSGDDLATPEFAELKRRFSWEWNGLRLHEYYFENIKNNSSGLRKISKLYKKLTESFVNYETWEKDFRAVSMMRGIGWAIAYYDPLNNRIFNTWITEHDTGHLCGAIPLLVMDVFEHAYMTDYGIKKADYLEAFFKAIDWDIASKRFEAAI